MLVLARMVEITIGVIVGCTPAVASLLRRRGFLSSKKFTALRSKVSLGWFSKRSSPELSKHKAIYLHQSKRKGQNRSLLKRVFSPSLWRSESGNQTTSGGHKAAQDDHFCKRSLPAIPRAHITGVRTFIDGCEVETHASCEK